MNGDCLAFLDKKRYWHIKNVDKIWSIMYNIIIKMRKSMPKEA